MDLQHFHTHSYDTEILSQVTNLGAVEGGYLVTATPTILYPGGGGQPADRGWLNGHPLAVVDGGYRVAGPVPDGMAAMTIDWERRYDHMQQHTGQHLISHLFENEFGLATRSFSMSRSEITFDTDELAPEQLTRIQHLANDIVRQARPVRAAVGADGNRVLEIAGIGAQPCGGTHLRSTAELQLVTLVPAGRGVAGFRTGNRALRYLADSARRDAALTAVLSTNPAGHIEAAEKLVAARGAVTKDLKATRNTLLGAIVSMIADNPERQIWHLGVVADSLLLEVAALIRARLGETRVLLTAFHPDTQLRWALTAAEAADEQWLRVDEQFTDLSRKGPVLLGTCADDQQILSVVLVPGRVALGALQ